MKHLLPARKARLLAPARLILVAAGVCMVLGLQSCGFALRGSQNFAFASVAVTPDKGSSVATELARAFGTRLRPLASDANGPPPEAVVDILEDVRDKAVTGVNASGQVREFQLRLRVRFRLRTPAGVELIGPTVVNLQRDMSFSESSVLAKEAEEQLLYRDMQADAVQQLLRRLSVVKTLAP